MKKIALFLACTSLIGFNMTAADNPAEPIFKEGKKNSISMMMHKHNC